MNLGALLREAAATVRASRVPSVLVALLVAVMCAATLATVGRTVAAERQVADRMDAAGSKVIVLRDLRGTDLFPPPVVDAAAHLSVTDRAVGLSLPVDVVNGAIGRGSTQAPAWRVIGDLAAVADLGVGRWPGPGEALVSEAARDKLGFAETYGWVTTGTDQVPVVGTYTVRAPFTDQAAGVLIAAQPADRAVTMHVLASSAALAPVAESTVVGLLGRAVTAQDLAVESPATLAQLQQSVARELGGANRSLVLGVMGAGALLVAIIVLADVLVRRKDLGRRRALGATRATIVALVVARTAIPALLGALAGTGLGLWAATRFNAAPGTAFTTAVAVLAVIAAITSSVLPAAYAAGRDPVEVLRTP